ncbi:MAG: undecaprenyl-diphosphate phosphatase [Tepidisphaerales bacterium]
MNDLLKAVILGVIEGVTEFLPVSSTGHMRLAEAWMGSIVSPAFAKTFDIFIQSGAIAAVLVYFRHRLLDLVGLRRPPPNYTDHAPLEPTQRRHLLLMLLLASLPLAIGYVAAKRAEEFYLARGDLETHVIAWALLLGGVLMILIERFRPAAVIEHMEEMRWPHALVIGLCQIVAAVFPGTSRSAATIVPALAMGMSRPVAAEFSFFLAIPALLGAGAIKLARFLRSPDVSLEQVGYLAVGTVVSFVVAYAVIAWFMRLIRRYSFTPFGVYRILVALVVFYLLYR